MLRVVKVRLYPNKSQKQAIYRTLGTNKIRYQTRQEFLIKT
jgi:transposase